MKTAGFWRISAVTTKPSVVRRNGLHSSFAPKQSVCKMSGSAARDKCAVGLTSGLTRNYSSQGLVSQSRVTATITSRHQGLLALRSPQGLSLGGGDNAFSLSSPPVKHFVIGMKPKKWEKKYLSGQLGLKILLNYSEYLCRSSAIRGERWRDREEARTQRASEAHQQLSAQEQASAISVDRCTS